MQPRIESPALSIPGVMQGLHRISAAIEKSNLPESTRKLIELRASQINGCSVCVDMHSRELKAAGEPDERVLLVSAWREAPYFSDAERAALALTEAATRLADRPDAVSDEIWEQAAEYYDEAQLAAIVVVIATINAWNRLNAATRQPTGEWIAEWIAPRETAPQAA